MQFLTLTVSTAYEGRTVASVLKAAFYVSDTYLRRLKTRPGSVCLNGAPVYVVERVHAGDTVSFDPSDGARYVLKPIPHPLATVYSDAYLTVIDKPKNLSVHPARDPDEPTVENALRAVYADDENPHPVSRLDKGTTGLMAIAKSGYIHACMKLQQADGRYQKRYAAILCGVPQRSHFFVDAPIGPKSGSTYEREVRSDGAPALSECTVLAVRDGLSLCTLVPHTGRTHQLRVHMAYAGFPLLGDWLYGTRTDAVDRPLLHAQLLCFEHPVTHERLSLSAPLPDDFRAYFPR